MSRSHTQQGSAARWFAILVSLVLVGYWLMPSLAQASGGNGFPAPTLPADEDVLGESEGTPTPVVASGGNDSPSQPTATPTIVATSTPTATATPIAATGTPSGSVGSTADVDAAIVVNPVQPKPDCICRLVPKTASTTPTPTKKPSPTPTKKPSGTKTPTKKPSPTPTKKPGVSKKPTPTPTKKPVGSTTKKPTPKPTKKPTNTPTQEYEEVCEYYYDLPSGAAGDGDVLGAYSCTPMSAVSGYIFADVNNNGRRDGSEVAYENVQIDLWKNVADTEIVEETAYTNADGYWEADLPPGEYTARLVPTSLPAGVSFPPFNEKIIVTEAIAEKPADSSVSVRSMWESLLKPSALWLLMIPVGIAAVAGVTLISLRKKGTV